MAIADLGWWPFIVAWVLAVAGVVAAATIALRHRTAYRRRLLEWHALEWLQVSTTLYLDEEQVTDLYDHLAGRIAPEHLTRVNQEVEERASSDNHVDARLDPSGPKLGAGRAAIRDKVIRFLAEEPKPTRMLMPIIDALDRDGGILCIELGVTPERPDAVVAGRAAERIGSRNNVVLSRLRPRRYVLISGDFTYREDGAVATVGASYGSAAGGAQLRLVGKSEKLRSSPPGGYFPAICLARVQTWDDTTGTLPGTLVAVFD